MKKVGIVLFVVLKVGIVYGLQTSMNGLAISKNTSVDACGSATGSFAGAGGCQLYNNEFDGGGPDEVHVYAVNDQTLAGYPWPESTVIIGGQDAGANNEFNTSTMDILLSNENAYIYNNDFNNAADGIYSEFSSYKYLTINNNRFNSVDRGVTIYTALQSRSLVSNNYFSVNAPGSPAGTWGIHIADDMWAGYNGAKMSINNNDMDLLGEYGIWLENLDMPFVTTHDEYKGVRNNDPINMYQTSNSPWYGIYLDQCTNSRVTKNNIIGFTLGGTNMAGKQAITLSQSTHGLVACNTTDLTEKALVFYNDCSDAAIKANELNYHDDGIVLKTSGVIGDQPCLSCPSYDEAPQNLFSGPFNTADLHSYDSYGDAYQFKYAAGFIPNVSTITGTGTAITPTADVFSTNYNCSNIALRQSNDNVITQNGVRIKTINKSGNNQALVDSSLIKIINTTITNDGSIEDATNYSQKVHLFEKFRQDTLLKNTDSTYTAWYDSSNLGNLGKLNQIKQLMFLATDTSQIHNDSALIAFYLNGANSINQSIIPTLVVESNKKAINNLYINKLVKHNYNLLVNEKTTVDTIAAKCPYSNGVAVIEARAIQRHWNDTMHYDNDDLCQISLPKQQNRKSANISNEIFVYPNPTNNILTLRCNNAGKLLIRDVTGRLLIEQRIEIPFTNIDVKMLEPGIYMLSVYSDKKVVNATQIIKIH